MPFLRCFGHRAGPVCAGMRSERLRKTTFCASSSALAPHGHQSGQVLFDGVPLADVPEREQVARIGFVMQDPDAQIVTDKVWHELPSS